MKIILIGNNRSGYEPYLFMKPDSALQKNNKPFFIPDFTHSITVSLCPVIRISKLGKNISERFAHRYFDAVTAGLDITAADIQDQCKNKSIPFEISNGFDGAAVVGNFISTTLLNSLETLHFRLNNNEKTIQEGSIKDLLYNADHIIAWISKYYTLKTGDLIYLGAFGCNEVRIDERMQGYMEEESLFDFHIR